jgi:hypothetical protein
MARPNRRLTPEERNARRKRRKETMLVFINGKQKRVKREPTIDGMNVDEFDRRNADPIVLPQNEMWKYMVSDKDGGGENGNRRSSDRTDDREEDMPF